MEVCMSAEYGMLDACVRSHEVSNDEMTRCACAVCQIPIAMKFAAFLFATISAAARLQQTSEAHGQIRCCSDDSRWKTAYASYHQESPIISHLIETLQLCVSGIGSG